MALLTLWFLSLSAKHVVFLCVLRVFAVFELNATLIFSLIIIIIIIKSEVKGARSQHYTPPLRRTGTSEQQQFVYNIRSGVLTGTSSRRRGAISGHPLLERTDFGPAVEARQNRTPMPQPAARWPSPCNVLRQPLDHYFSSVYVFPLTNRHTLNKHKHL